jgi:hypothetical protein
VEPQEDHILFFTLLSLQLFNFGCRYVWLHHCKLTSGMFCQSMADSFWFTVSNVKVGLVGDEVERNFHSISKVHASHLPFGAKEHLH